MAATPLDAVDRDILYRLQQDADQSATSLASALDVAEEAVRGRIDDLERRDVLQRYTVDVDYARAGVQHYFQFVCTARVSQRESLVRAARRIPGVVRVLSLMTGRTRPPTSRGTWIAPASASSASTSSARL